MPNWVIVGTITRSVWVQNVGFTSQQGQKFCYMLMKTGPFDLWTFSDSPSSTIVIFEWSIISSSKTILLMLRFGRNSHNLVTVTNLKHQLRWLVLVLRMSFQWHTHSIIFVGAENGWKRQNWWVYEMESWYEIKLHRTNPVVVYFETVHKWEELL